MPTALVVVLVLVAAVFAPAAGEEMPGDEVSGEEEGAHRSCGTLEPTVQEREYQKKKLIEFRRIQPEAARAARLDFKVVVHIIHDGDTGKLSVDNVEKQIDVLNEAYAGATHAADGFDTGMRFNLDEITYTDNSYWYKSCKTSSYKFRKQMNKDSKEFINIYTCSGDGYLGWTWLPWSHDEGDWLQAVILNFNSFPGGTMSRYNLGYTAVHEMGHYMGLLHTFSGGSCTAEGDDGVDDTPLESSPASSCNTYKRDTCPNAKGYDPIWSFMDYSYDQCMQRFSPGQGARLLEMVNLHRPQLVRNSINEDAAVNAPPPPPPAPMPCGSNFGCCGSSNIPKTSYLGSNCPCDTTKFGCCGSSDITQQDSRGESCPCATTKHGCCGSSTTAKYDAVGTNCPCGTTAYGCCGSSYIKKQDTQGSNCPCEITEFGCCGSTETPMRDSEGSNCHCSESLYGCCGMTAVRQIDAAGSNCPCSSTQFGCCGSTDVKQDNAFGSNCPCQATTFGCCGESEVAKVNAMGSNCHCTDTLYGCCGESSIQKINLAGTNCPCETRPLGCCPSPHVTMIKTDMLGTNCPVKTTTVAPTPTYAASVSVSSVGAGNIVVKGNTFDVTVVFATSVPAPVQLVAIFYSKSGLLLGSSDFEDVPKGRGTATLAVAFHGAVDPQLGCTIKVSLVRADVAAASSSWMNTVEAQTEASNIAVIAAEVVSTPSTETQDANAFSGCSSASSWNECLNTEPYKTECNWGGHPKSCYSVTEVVLDTSPSTKTCDELVTADNMWQTKHPLVCGGSRTKSLTCLGSQDVVKASAKCRLEGARLCTSDELKDGATRQSGCGYNFRYGWTSTICDGGYIVRTGNPDSAYPPLCVEGDMASATTYDVMTRCCADKAAGSTVVSPTPPSAPASAPASDSTSVAAPSTETLPCKDIALTSNCRMWQNQNFCEVDTWDFFMRKNCPLTCNFCGPSALTVSDFTIAMPDPSKQTTPGFVDTFVDGNGDACDLKIRKRCVNPKKGCCAYGSVCMEMGKTMKCRALPFRGKATNPMGHPCEKHKTCASGWCDKKGRYSPEAFMCWEKEVMTKKPDGTTWYQLEGSGPTADSDASDGEMNTRLILVSIAIIVLIALGVVLAICIFSSYSKACKKQKRDTGGSSDGTGESDLIYAFTATNTDQPASSVNGSQRPYASVVDQMSRASSFANKEFTGKKKALV